MRLVACRVCMEEASLGGPECDLGSPGAAAGGGACLHPDPAILRLLARPPPSLL